MEYNHRYQPQPRTQNPLEREKLQRRRLKVLFCCSAYKIKCNGWPAGGKSQRESVTGEQRACTGQLVPRGARAGLRHRASSRDFFCVFFFFSLVDWINGREDGGGSGGQREEANERRRWSRENRPAAEKNGGEAAEKQAQEREEREGVLLSILFNLFIIIYIMISFILLFLLIIILLSQVD